MIFPFLGNRRPFRVGGAHRVRSAALRPRGAPSSRSPWRVAIVGIGLLAAAALVLGRAYMLQIQHGDRYGGVAERQSVFSSRITAKRGVVKDRHGAELAITVDVDSVYAEPRRVEDPEGTARLLSPILGVPEARLLKKLKTDRAFTYLKRRVSPGIAVEIRKRGLPGLGVHQEPQRFYSNRELAAHVLGFLSSDGIGRAGVERWFDSELRGKSYDVPGLVDALGNKVLSEGFVPESVLEGSEIALTIDRQIQHAAEEALRESVVNSRAKGGVAIVVEPRSGEILALASYPTFNPNNLQGTTADHHLNRAVNAVFEPGSTMKMVTIAAALEEKVLRADDRIDCEGGKWRVGGRTIADDRHKFGVLSVAEIMKMSSNICAAKIGMSLGRERLHDWLYRFGFGVPTGIDLPGELKGIISPVSKWRDISLANISFGQGIAVTPIQLLLAASVVANDGRRVPLRLVRSIRDESGSHREMEHPEATLVLQPATARAVREMMVEVTEKGGTAEAAAVPGFRVAGKTGTAQKIDPVTRRYSHERHVASFVGFLPAEQPDVAILVMVDEPRTSMYGGVIAAPVFRRIALAALAAREVFPEGGAPLRDAFLADYRVPAEELASAPSLAPDEDPASEPSDAPPLDPRLDARLDEGSLLEVGLSGEAQVLLGMVGEDELALGSAVEEATSTQLPTGPDEGPRRMLNFAGLRAYEVLDRSADVQCDPVLIGRGRVVEQSPPPGAVLRKGERCELKLALPKKVGRGGVAL